MVSTTAQPATEPGATGTGCVWCAGGCAGADLKPLLDERLTWLWQQVAKTADRRGDPDLTTGTVTVTAPHSAEQRAAAVGLLGGRTPAAGKNCRVDLDYLTVRLRARGPALTPGVVAAHATGRRLAVKAQAKVARQETVAQLHRFTVDVFTALPGTAPVRPDIDQVWPVLHTAGWVTRLAGMKHAQLLLRQAADVIAALPPAGQRLDRRRLADRVTRFPHALDAGPLPSLVLAVLTAASVIPAGLRNRAAWDTVGVDCDDLTGGLITIGVHPAGWILPPAATVTLPPRELVRCEWTPSPSAGGWVFVTENPSVATAAADLADTLPAGRPPVRLLCTAGTPSSREIDAIARLAAAGWRVAVRADFDEAGLNHVAALLAGVPGAVPWRMSAADYLASLASAPSGAEVPLDGSPLPATGWDPELQVAMADRQLAAFEETLLDDLLHDLRQAPDAAQAT